MKVKDFIKYLDDLDGEVEIRMEDEAGSIIENVDRAGYGSIYLMSSGTR